MIVSILARPEGRALPCGDPCYYAADLFQSSPAPKGGRYRWSNRFIFMDQHVSILARPEGRALRPAPALDLQIRQSFNPRPPRRAGAT